MEVLNEVYFGKVIALQQLEDVITKLKIKYESDANSKPFLVYHAINKDELIQKMARLIKEQFGFGEVIVTISKESKLRASTVSFLADRNGIIYLDDMKPEDVKNAVVVTREGIRYDSRKLAPSILIIITMGLLFSKMIESSEIVAALLHEIGHSFSKATLSSDEFNSRIDEKFADQFANMYGYGTELNKILTFITSNQNEDLSIFKDVPVLNIFIGLSNISRSLMSRVIKTNDHPTIDRRVKDSIKQMEYELSRAENLTPKQKRELKMNIERSKQVLDSFYNDTPDLSSKVYKYYMKNIEPTLGKEIKADDYANTYGSVNVVDKALSSMIKR